MALFDVFLNTIVPFLIVLTILVFVHEMGHYLVARRNGVRVEVFSIGFGPELFGWNDKAQTRWKISLIPLGGYVKMFGDANAASAPGSEAATAAMTEEERKVAFHTKRLDQRAWIVVAGPAANFIFAIVLLTAQFATIGQSFTPAVVGEVLPGSAAEAAGFLPGDRVINIDGGEIERFEEMQRYVMIRPDQEMQVTVLREGREVVLAVTPSFVEIEDNLGGTQKVGRLGVSRAGFEFVKHGPFTAFWQACKDTVSLTWNALTYIGKIITGTLSADGLAGPIGIAQISGEVANYGIGAMIGFMALLSINLGMINLFPIPMLDGGHLLFYAIEAVIGRPLGERAQEYSFRIGLALVLGLVLFVTYNDLGRIGLFDFMKNLVS